MKALDDRFTRELLGHTLLCADIQVVVVPLNVRIWGRLVQR